VAKGKTMKRKPTVLARRIILVETGMLLAGILASGILVSSVVAQTGTSTQTAPAVKPAADMTPYRNQPDLIPKRAAAFYESVWGIQEPSIKAVESGILLRFSYRVLDPAKAKPLIDKKIEPSLESPEKGVSLVVPLMEKVGKLRQTPDELEAGKTYWLAFSNSGRVLKPGDRVDVAIGNFHARGLLVQ